MFQNYPNPVKELTKVKELGEKASLGLKVHNLVGQLVYETEPVMVNAGIRFITMDASALDAGVYFYTVNANGKEITRKMIVD
ncbi:MAG: T9SS type A sorting domain-containing protein [Bacteroidales bacterium]